MATLKQLQKRLEIERNKLSKERRIEENITSEINKKRKIEAELFRLKHRKIISRTKKARSLSKRFGKSLLKTGSRIGKKVGPAIIKQGKLIREQQLRDDARETALLKRQPAPKRKSKRKAPRSKTDDPFSMF